MPSCPANFKLPFVAHGTVAGLQRFLNTEISKANMSYASGANVGSIHYVLRGMKPLVVDGKCGPLTYAAWLKYSGSEWEEKVGSPDTRPGLLPQVPAPSPWPEPGSRDTKNNEEKPMMQEPWFWFVAVSLGVVLIIALRSKKR